MRTVGFSGKSGCGKSYRALSVAALHNLKLIVDDGLLICDGKVLAGKSAKKERHPYASTLRAIFNDEIHAKEVSDAIIKSGHDSILILGTSERMVNLIADRIGVAPVEKHIHIEDVASPEEIEKANLMRSVYGKHVIPVPTFEIKRTFSGYLLDPLTSIKKLANGFFDKSAQAERTIVRPKYGYRGDFEISDTVLCQIAAYEVSKIQGVADVNKVIYYHSNGDNEFRIDICIDYGIDIKKTCMKIQDTVIKAIDDCCLIYVDTVHVNVEKIITQK
ncbi:MAG: hypothetical protein II998_10960 [Clostridia bacterium]|nr:hypothetical protein [Clostridia bacterium]